MGSKGRARNAIRGRLTGAVADSEHGQAVNALAPTIEVVCDPRRAKLDDEGSPISSPAGPQTAGGIRRLVRRQRKAVARSHGLTNKGAIQRRDHKQGRGSEGHNRST